MRHFLLLFILPLAFTASSQSKREQIKSLKSERVEWKKTNDSLNLELNALRSEREVMEFELRVLEKQNDELKIIMKSYIYYIDSLYTVNKALATSSSEPTPEPALIAPEKKLHDYKPAAKIDRPLSELKMFKAKTESKRDVIKHIIADIEVDDVLNFYYTVTINARGDVINCTPIEGRINTTDQVLINKLRMAIIEHVKYNEVPNAPINKQVYSFTVRPN